MSLGNKLRENEIINALVKALIKLVKLLNLKFQDNYKKIKLIQIYNASMKSLMRLKLLAKYFYLDFIF